MLNIISAIVSGLIIGALARFFYPGAVVMGWGMTILLGVAGSVLAGIVTSRGRSEFQPAGCLASVIGAMVLISSAAATLGGPGEYVWYAASKGGIESMTYGLSKELALDRIRVNALAPGLIETGIHPPGRLERMAPLVPVGRAGTPEEIAESILFLLSDASSYTTGTVLRVAGGR